MSLLEMISDYTLYVYIFRKNDVSLLIIMIEPNLITNLKLIVASITIYCYYLHMR
jgi:hypothetical protein